MRGPTDKAKEEKTGVWDPNPTKILQKNERNLVRSCRLLMVPDAATSVYPPVLRAVDVPLVMASVPWTTMADRRSLGCSNESLVGGSEGQCAYNP